MQPRLKFVLLLGAVLATGASAAVAEMNKTPPAGQFGGYHSYGGRIGGRFLSEYDLNHDGKITRDEFNRAEGAHFASMAHGQPVNAQQFAADAVKKHRDRVAQQFRRADWNSDGKLTLEEYQAPLRAKFSYADRKTPGVVSCAPRSANSNFGARFGANNDGQNNGRRRGMSSRGLCFGNDVNQDGKVTRAEFDASTAKQFAAITHGGKTMSFDQYAGVDQGKFLSVNARIFKHLDDNSDGKLTLAELAAPHQKQFARFDANHDGVVTRDEINAAPRSNYNRGRSRG
jgi:Ca2+-binding EF-hand superfamily protein